MGTAPSGSFHRWCAGWNGGTLAVLDIESWAPDHRYWRGQSCEGPPRHWSYQDVHWPSVCQSKATHYPDPFQPDPCLERGWHPERSRFGHRSGGAGPEVPKPLGVCLLCGDRPRQSEGHYGPLLVTETQPDVIGDIAGTQTPQQTIDYNRLQWLGYTANPSSFLDKSSSQFSKVNSFFLKSLAKPSSGRWSFNWQHKACIHAEEIINFSLDSCRLFFQACKLRSSGFSIREKKPQVLLPERCWN